MRIRGTLLLTLFMLAAFAGCGSTQPASVATATALAKVAVDGVHIVRTSDAAPGTLPAFDYTGKDSAKVHALYSGLLQLPAYTANGASCPTDSGVQYQLTFMNGGAVVLSAIADPSGCQVAVLGGHDNRLAANSDLWTLMANAVGVSPSAVYPIPTH